MLIRFSSTKTEPLIMHGGVASELIKMLGASGRVPGAIGAEDIPEAVARLQEQLAVLQPAADDAQADTDDDSDQREPIVELTVRAVPLIDLLQRAAKGNATVMWEAM